MARWNEAGVLFGRALEALDPESRASMRCTLDYAGFQHVVRGAFEAAASLYAQALGSPYGEDAPEEQVLDYADLLLREIKSKPRAGVVVKRVLEGDPDNPRAKEMLALCA